MIVQRRTSCVRFTTGKLIGLLVTGGALVAAGGCIRQYVVSDSGPQAYYQTAFPIGDTSGELARITESIYRIGTTSYYTTYRFALEDSVTDADIRLRSTFERARERYTFDHSKAGTAAVIASAATGVTLLTNDHVTRTPDTIIVRFGNQDSAVQRQEPAFIESISIRTRQRNYVSGLPEVLPFDVMARDSANDLALIRVTLRDADRRASIRVLNVPLGDAGQLSWGSFVYVIGFPRGYQMVTRGIVSDPGYTSGDGFLIDGLFNRGISGGIILAIRSDTGLLEWVGVTSSAAGQSEYRLAPEARDIQEDGLLLPYEGRLYIEKNTRIEYGITFPVPSTAIRNFLRSARMLSNGA